MKTIGKVLTGWVLVVILMLGVPGVTKADIWIPDLTINTITLSPNTVYELTDPDLVLTKTLIMVPGSDLIGPDEFKVINQGSMFVEDSIVSGAFTQAPTGSLEIEGYMVADGFFSASGNVSLGRIRPLPPPPPPGHETSDLGVFLKNFEGDGEASFIGIPNLLIGSALLATGAIDLDTLALDFISTADYTPTAGDRFLLAASLNSTVNIGAVTHNLESFGLDLRIDRGGFNPTDAYIATIVPEPGTLLLLGFGLLGLAGIGRKRSV